MLMLLLGGYYLGCAVTTLQYATSKHDKRNVWFTGAVSVTCFALYPLLY